MEGKSKSLLTECGMSFHVRLVYVNIVSSNSEFVECFYHEIGFIFVYFSALIEITIYFFPHHSVNVAHYIDFHRLKHPCIP